ncbi:MAG: hypothetical protein K5650_06235 [Bacteroidales bacterium]|nr:hypothetical protein [Bacteroidales bacterium]
MSNYLKQDRYDVGIVLGIGSLAIALALVVVGLTIGQVQVADNLRLFGLAFIPLILILRHYAKRKEQPKVTKALIVVIFASFIAFMALIMSTKALDLQ